MQAQPAKECGIMDIREQAFDLFSQLNDNDMSEILEVCRKKLSEYKIKVSQSDTSKEQKKREREYNKIKKLLLSKKTDSDDENIDYKAELDQYFAEKYGL